ncbi:MAG: hypothetical protein KA986_00445 [Aliarcobacter sp.]|nr:hypothetical protein [Aliarcobacter sp.]MBP9766111.1 hypothetical protein [Candidatus Paceibacterota bacterium]
MEEESVIGKYTEILPLLKKILEDEEKIKENEKYKIDASCKNKGLYYKKSVETIRNFLNKKGQRVREYHCDLCNYWHLTHKI